MFFKYLNIALIGVFKIRLNVILKAAAPNLPTKPKILRIPNVNVNPIPPSINKSFINLSLNSFNASILSPEANLINVNALSVNHPPASIMKKLPNLASNPCAFLAILRTGIKSAFCIFLSNSLSLPSLRACSAKILSLFLFSFSLCLSRVSLNTKLSLIIFKELLSELTCTLTVLKFLDKLFNANEFCCNKLVV